jgi:hypothetical protein
MSTHMICYTFSSSVPLEEVESSLLLALLGTESLHGETSTRLDAAHRIDRHDRCVAIDASTEPGRDFNRLFLGFVTREFGSDSFEVQRVTEPKTPKPPSGLSPPEWN